MQPAAEIKLMCSVHVVNVPTVENGTLGTPGTPRTPELRNFVRTHGILIFEGKNCNHNYPQPQESHAIIVVFLANFPEL